MRSLLAVRQDVYGTTTRKPAWRLEDLPDDHVRMVDLLIDSNLDALLDEVRPRTIFNCVAYGAYSFETDSQLIYRTNFHFITRLLPRLEARSIACYVHAGSSSEYGDNAAGPAETRPDGAQQRLRRVQGRRRQPDLLLRQAQELPLRQPPALLRLRAARGLVAADPQRRSATAWKGPIPTFVNPADLARFRLRRRRDRGVRRHRAEPDRGRLRRVVQHRHRPEDHHRRGRGDCPRAVRDRRRAVVHHARALLGRPGLVRQHREGPDPAGLGAADLLPRGPAARPSTGIEACPTRRSTTSRPRSSAWTPSTASARSSPATRTTRRSRSCTSGSRRRSPS